MRYKILLSASFLLTVLGTSFAHAQFSNAPSPVEYTVSPEAPGPNQKVYIDIKGLGSFVGNSTITWEENGRVVSSGVGITSYIGATAGVGSVMHVKVTISGSGESIITHDFYFAPSVVYLTWEADTSAPLFYMGKSLYSAGSQLKIVAIPFVVSGSSLVGSDRLSFQWTHNDNKAPSQSGLGKNVLVLTGDQLQGSERLALDVIYKGVKVGHAEIAVPAVDPQVLMYDRDPLRGELAERALPATFNLNTNELTLQAEPYFFANKSVSAGKLSYSWTINGQDTLGPDSARGLLTLRQSGQGSGGAVVGVSVQNLDDDKLVQSARQALQITFGDSTGNSISSFLGL